MNVQDYSVMNKELKKIGEEILEKERECLINLGRDVKSASFGGKYQDQYYAQVGQNLWAGIPQGEEKDTYPHFKEYDGGSGGELKDSKTPAKMKSIRSSSAMTYNLLGNRNIDLIDGKGHFAEGRYTIEYEKKLYTIRRNPQPANLDAYLYNAEKEEVIFCEMKMMEWIFNEPGILKDAYTKPEFYYANNPEGAETVEAFRKAIDMLNEEMPTFKGKKHFFRYDAWQMFKHTLGIYNMTSSVTGKEINGLIEKSKADIKSIPHCKKVTLVNVVFEPPKEVLSNEVQATYEKFVAIEHEDFDTFRRIMIESGVVEAFKRDCKINFDIRYMTVAQFIDCFDVLGRRKYLKRYTLSEE